MPLDRLFEIVAGPGGVLFSMLIFVMAAFVIARFRNESWILFVWFPDVVISAYGTIAMFRCLGLLMRGGWDSLGALFFIPLTIPFAINCVTLFLLLPKRSAWKPLPVFFSVIATVLLYWLAYLGTTTPLVIHVSDLTHAAIPNQKAAVDVQSYGVTEKKYFIYSDNDGNLKLRLQPQEEVHISILGDLGGQAQWGHNNTNWDFRIYRNFNDKALWEIWNEWSSLEIRQTLKEYEPFNQKISIDVTLKPANSLELLPLIESKVKKEFSEALSDHDRPDLDLLSCRNIESLNFIPEITSLYKSNATYRSESIRAIADLAEIICSLGGKEKKLARESTYVENRDESVRIGVFYDTLESMYRWSGGTKGDASYKEKLEVINGKVSGYLNQILSFCQDNIGSDSQVLMVIENLREFGKPLIPVLSEVYMRGDHRIKVGISDVLRHMKPSSSELSWMTDSSDFETVIDGYTI
jgi:hypothetical protein